MPTVTIPSRDITLDFPEDATESEVLDYIDRVYPRNGKDVEYDMKTRLVDPDFSPTFSDFQLLRDYSKSKDISLGEIAEGVFKGVAQLGKDVLSAIPSLGDAGHIAPSAAEALAQNISGYELLAKGGTDPGSTLFNALNSSNEFMAYATWRDNILQARRLAQAAEGVRTLTGLDVNKSLVSGFESAVQ